MRYSVPLAVSLAALGCAADNVLTADKVEADITTEGLRFDLEFLEIIAAHNNGNRAAGTPGFRDSVTWVLSQAEAAGMNAHLQNFTFFFEQTKRINLTGPAGEAVYIISPQFNSPSPLPGGVTAPLTLVPATASNGTGCTAAQWAAVPGGAAGKIALLGRDGCGVNTKIQLAQQHGAAGVLSWNPGPGTDYITGSLWAYASPQAPPHPPVGIIPLEVADAWRPRLERGEVLNVTLVVDSVNGVADCWNVIAETPEGDADSVVMLGAHLDSVLRGPGINDDGSGTAALLEIMKSVSKYTGIKNKLRFVWWGAEEEGTLGSYFYTDHLTEVEKDRIKFYFNYDMIGSIKPIWAVGKGVNSGEVVPNLLADYLHSKGKTTEWDEFDGGSDHDGFNDIGVPVSGLFTGAGGVQDPCYHRACDSIANINWEAISINSKAAGRVLARLALSLEGVPPRNKTAEPQPRLLRRRDDLVY